MASNASFESVGFDFEASDAIFADDEPTANDGDNDNDDGEENADEDNDCDCSTCRERMRHKEELNRYEINSRERFQLGYIDFPKKSINVLTSFLVRERLVLLLIITFEVYTYSSLSCF